MIATDKPEMEENPEPEGEPEPEEGDYIIGDGEGPLGGGHAVSQYGKRVWTGVERDDAEAFIREHAAQNQFWPNVWVLSDHGNAHPAEFRWE